MRTVPLEAIPNQEFTLRLDDHSFVLRIKEASGVMVADVTIDGVKVLDATRVLAGTPIIPYRYLAGAGNFLMLTEAGDLPAYAQFGVTQRLIYASAAELAAL